MASMRSSAAWAPTPNKTPPPGNTPWRNDAGIRQMPRGIAMPEITITGVFIKKDTAEK
ncbi:MAG TPA: hypothetical protein PKA19_15895 [Bacillota bacterium]|nr:hypothetical protein [Bacillota bacterium]